MNSSAGTLVETPPGPVTITSTVPVPAGLVAVISVAERTSTLVAALAPKLTFVASVKLVPVIVTDVPPTVGPSAGLMPVTAGAAR